MMSSLAVLAADPLEAAFDFAVRSVRARLASDEELLIEYRHDPASLLLALIAIEAARTNLGLGDLAGARWIGRRLVFLDIEAVRPANRAAGRDAGFPDCPGLARDGLALIAGLAHEHGLLVRIETADCLTSRQPTVRILSGQELPLSHGAAGSSTAKAGASERAGASEKIAVCDRADRVDSANLPLVLTGDILLADDLFSYAAGERERQVRFALRGTPAAGAQDDGAQDDGARVDRARAGAVIAARAWPLLQGWSDEAVRRAVLLAAQSPQVRATGLVGPCLAKWVAEIWAPSAGKPATGAAAGSMKAGLGHADLGCRPAAEPPLVSSSAAPGIETGGRRRRLDALDSWLTALQGAVSLRRSLALELAGELLVLDDGGLSPEACEVLLRFALTLDNIERERCVARPGTLRYWPAAAAEQHELAASAEISPPALIDAATLIAIDFNWALYGYFRRPFVALRAWHDITNLRQPVKMPEPNPSAEPALGGSAERALHVPGIAQEWAPGIGFRTPWPAPQAGAAKAAGSSKVGGAPDAAGKPGDIANAPGIEFTVDPVRAARFLAERAVVLQDMGEKLLDPSIAVHVYLQEGIVLPLDGSLPRIHVQLQNTQKLIARDIWAGMPRRHLDRLLRLQAARSKRGT